MVGVSARSMLDLAGPALPVLEVVQPIVDQGRRAAQPEQRRGPRGRETVAAIRAVRMNGFCPYQRCVAPSSSWIRFRPTLSSGPTATSAATSLNSFCL